jgi:hypothetical protein
MTSDEVFLTGLDVFDPVIHQLGHDAWDSDSPENVMTTEAFVARTGRRPR